MSDGSGDEAWQGAAIARLLETPGTAGFLACRPDRLPAGFVLVRAVADEAEILTLAVVPCARRQGIAKSLMRAAAGYSRRCGAERLLLEVAVDNAAARGLYDTLGFAQLGRRPGYYRRPGRPAMDCLIMSLSLAAPASSLTQP